MAVAAFGMALAGAIACAATDDRPDGLAPATGGTTSTGSDAGPVARCTDGDTRECWVEIGYQGEVLSCIHGQQICVDGLWSACEGDEVTARSAPSQPMAFSDAGTCNNPCDPTCQIFEEDPDGATTSDPTTVILHGGDIWSVIPGGFVGKYLKQPCVSDCDCQADHQCIGGVCSPYWPGETDPDCPSDPDYTAAVPCGGRLPVCNRGQVDGPDPPAPLILYVQPGNCLQAQDPFCSCAGFGCSNPLIKCTVTTTIPAGECIFLAPADCVDAGSGAQIGAFSNGADSVVVNSMDFPGALPECRCDNNWSPKKSPNADCPTVDLYEPLVRKEIYEGFCELGEYVQWGYLGYEADTPSNASGDSSVLIEAHTANLVADISGDCSDCVTLAHIDSTHPDDCPLTGPAPCPIDLYAALDLPAAQHSVLELVFSLTPAPDRQAGPDVMAWDITYSCVAAE